MTNQTTFSLIWAQDENGLIGKDGQLPWRLPADLTWFKKQTMGKPILMGRTTYESIGKPLPGRTNIVLTHQADFQAEGCTVVHSIDEAEQVTSDAEEIMVIGGAKVYAQLLPHASQFYMTLIHAEFDGDTQFPNVDLEGWRETSREDHEPDEANAYSYSFITLERKQS